MDRLDEISAFAAVADARSFTQAARRLGVSGAQVSKLVARLEDRLGARLLNRTTRDVSLTDTGRAYLERARVLLEDFETLEDSVREESGPSGLLRISAPVSFGSKQLDPALLDFAAAYPSVSLEVFYADRMVNLVDEGFDVAIRIGRLPDSSLIARRLAPVTMIACASPAYLQKHGAPQSPSDLAAHEAIIDLNTAEPNLWSFAQEGECMDVRVHGRLRFAGAESCLAAAERGLGVARSPDFIAADRLREGRLTPLLCGFEPEVIAVHAVYPHSRHLAAKVRVFVDFLAERFAGEPEWRKGWGEPPWAARRGALPVG
ncbi:MAG TPA: LysR family transcriptional regulator [Phenylobacterium sp.]|uniref:LysR family transcriptional regulator n=1 Tax=Phenylobacterium sp. TaxID=1871053 RepID=UPI002C48D570|nr:LysR family transcriptional regulator [Phenylobacterium sp.]HSV04648.1 LysR family transcriptional regulator [Phenylobacterium sp.]